MTLISRRSGLLKSNLMRTSKSQSTSMYSTRITRSSTPPMAWLTGLGTLTPLTMMLYRAHLRPTGRAQNWRTWLQTSSRTSATMPRNWLPPSVHSRWPKCSSVWLMKFAIRATVRSRVRQWELNQSSTYTRAPLPSVCASSASPTRAKPRWPSTLTASKPSHSYSEHLNRRRNCWTPPSSCMAVSPWTLFTGRM